MKKKFWFALPLLLIPALAGLVRADSLFLSRQTENKWSLTPYYVSQMSSGWGIGSGDQVEWQFGGQMMMFQPSVRLGERINMYMTLGTGETFRSFGRGQIADESTFGGTYSYGMGWDWKVSKESDELPLVGLKFGVSRLSGNYRNLWREHDGTVHDITGTAGVTDFTTWSIGMSFSKKLSKSVEIAVGGGVDNTFSNHITEYMVVGKRSPIPWPLPDDVLWIPLEMWQPPELEKTYDINNPDAWAEYHRKKYELVYSYFWTKYPEYWSKKAIPGQDPLPGGWPDDLQFMYPAGDSFISYINHMNRVYASVEGRIILPNDASIITGIQIGRTLGFSLGYTVGF